MYIIENLKKIRQMLIDNRSTIESRFNMSGWCATPDPDYPGWAML